MENFDKIYELYAADVYHYALSLCMNEATAKDILQNTMLKAFTHYDKFRGDCSVKTWLFGIAKNEHLNNANVRTIIICPLTMPQMPLMKILSIASATAFKLWKYISFSIISMSPTRKYSPCVFLLN